jgi:hypothetical protein
MPQSSASTTPTPQPPNSSESWSHDFQEVLTRELDLVGDPEIVEADPIVRAHRKQLLGLSLSGGGIRSATFNLGVLQALAQLRLLSRVDYLSTVSGGGYIGSWLMAWIKRRGLKDVERALRPEWKGQPGNSEPGQIRFLRRFSNYLTPKLGWLGADTWTVIAVYVRNLILNLLVLAAAFAVVLLVPRFVGLGSVELLKHFPQRLVAPCPLTVFQAVAIFALAALGIAAWNIIWSLRHFITRRPDRSLPSVVLPPLDNWEEYKGKEYKGYRYYPAKLFDGDFILHLDFTAKERGSCYVRLWAPMKKGFPPGPAIATVRVSDEGIIPSAQSQGVRETGQIETDGMTHAPACRAEVQAGLNRLEIVSSEGRCTVRVNKLTVNTVRVRLPKRRSILPWRRRTFAMAIEDCGKIAFEPRYVERLESASDIGATQGQVQFRIIVPLLLAAFFGTFAFGFGDVTPETAAGCLVPSMRAAAGLPTLPAALDWLDYVKFAGMWCAIGVFSIRAALKFWTYLVAGGAALRRWWSHDVRPRVTWPVENDPASWIRVVGETVSIAVAVSVGGLIVWALYHLFRGGTVWEIIIWGTPALIGAFIVTVILHIGLMGRHLGDERREWWSRINAWLLIYSLAWLAVFTLALCTPLIIAKMGEWITRVVTLGWITSTLFGLIAARSAATRNGHSNRTTDLVAKVAPYIFVLGFFIFLAWAIDEILPLVAGLHIDRTAGGLLGSHPLTWNWWWLSEVGKNQAAMYWVAAVSFFIAFLLALRLDINQFSMHMLYRNRLGRCYLGASNELRRAQPFTGFSPEDDFDLSELMPLWSDRDNGRVPFPIINAALNLVGGKELAWQQRKAASFVFTPLFCGYDFAEQPPGYCPTKEFAGRPSAVTLATAMAISGAAVSPNMGYHTSPAPAFLMTVFNVRLGWWLGNPRTKRTWQRSGPLNVLLSLMRELFGLTSEEGKYIYLSDGGHFENLGIYELVRRRCRFIVASDAEEDHAFGFSGLGNAIEKCRSDFGIDIDIDVEPIRRRSEKGDSQWHCAIGRIFYSRVDPQGRDGILVYIKSSLTGDEPTDALRYAAANPEFPHQTTGDQWFDESQFESYRVLGYHITQNVFLPVQDRDGISNQTNEELFLRLAEHWYPPSALTAESFTKHTESIIRLYNELRTNENLDFLSRDIYPEWRLLFEESPLKSPGLAFKQPEISRAQLPKSSSELKAGFYVCTAICDIFEAVYIDLHLDQEFDHPDNRGWMNFFRHWASAPMFRVMWLISASNYGARFQSFCSRYLNLEMGCARPTGIASRPLTSRRTSGEISWTEDIGTVAENIVNTICPWVSGLQSGSEVISRAMRTVSAEVPDSKVPSTHGMAEERAIITKAKESVLQELNRARAAKNFSNEITRSKDEIWFAAATLLEFLRREVSDDKFAALFRERVAALALVHAASIAGLALSKEFQTELNPTERELIELFLIFNPGFASSVQIIRLSMTPQSDRDCSYDEKQDLSFPFGFVLLAHTAWPPEKPQEPKLVYLRVQNHLRQIGLARKGLKALLAERPGLDIDLQKMHPDADEIPSENDYARLRRIYGSVKTEMRQKGSV